MPRLSTAQKTLAGSVPKLPLIGENFDEGFDDYGTSPTPMATAPTVGLQHDLGLNQGLDTGFDLFWQGSSETLCIPAWSRGSTNTNGTLIFRAADLNTYDISTTSDTQIYQLINQGFVFNDINTLFSIRQLSTTTISNPTATFYSEQNLEEPSADVYGGNGAAFTLLGSPETVPPRTLGLRVQHSSSSVERGETVIANYGFYANDYLCLEIRVQTTVLGPDPLP